MKQKLCYAHMVKNIANALWKEANIGRLTPYEEIKSNQYDLSGLVQRWRSTEVTLIITDFKEEIVIKNRSEKDKLIPFPCNTKSQVCAPLHIVI